MAKQTLGGASSWGWILAAGAAGSAAGGLAALRLRPERPMLVAYRMLWLEAAPLAALALRAPLGVVALASALAGAQLAFSGVMWETAIQEHIAPELRSRISAWDWLGTFALLPAGLAVAGPLSAVLGVSGVLWLGAGCMVVSTAAVACVDDVRSLRRVLPTRSRASGVENVSPSF